MTKCGPSERDKAARRILYATGLFDSPAEIAENRDHPTVRDAYYAADRMIALGVSLGESAPPVPKEV